MSLTPTLGTDVLTHLALLCVLLPHQVDAVFTNCVVATAALPVLLYVSGIVTAVAPLYKLNPLALAVATVTPSITTVALPTPASLTSMYVFAEPGTLPGA